jgi:hypothetical protein
MDAVISDVSNDTVAATLVVGIGRAPVEFAAPTGPSSLSCTRARCSDMSAGSVSSSRKEGVVVIIILVLDDFERDRGFGIANLGFDCSEGQLLLRGEDGGASGAEGLIKVYKEGVCDHTSSCPS